MTRTDRFVRWRDLVVGLSQLDAKQPAETYLRALPWDEPARYRTPAKQFLEDIPW